MVENYRDVFGDVVFQRARNMPSIEALQSMGTTDVLDHVTFWPLPPRIDAAWYMNMLLDLAYELTNAEFFFVGDAKPSTRMKTVLMLIPFRLHVEYCRDERRPDVYDFKKTDETVLRAILLVAERLKRSSLVHTILASPTPPVVSITRPTYLSLGLRARIDQALEDVQTMDVKQNGGGGGSRASNLMAPLLAPHALWTSVIATTTLWTMTNAASDGEVPSSTWNATNETVTMSAADVAMTAADVGVATAVSLAWSFVRDHVNVSLLVTALLSSLLHRTVESFVVRMLSIFFYVLGAALVFSLRLVGVRWRYFGPDRSITHLKTMAFCMDLYHDFRGRRTTVLFGRNASGWPNSSVILYKHCVIVCESDKENDGSEHGSGGLADALNVRKVLEPEPSKTPQVFHVFDLWWWPMDVVRHLSKEDAFDFDVSHIFFQMPHVKTAWFPNEFRPSRFRDSLAVNPVRFPLQAEACEWIKNYVRSPSEACANEGFVISLHGQTKIGKTSIAGVLAHLLPECTVIVLKKISERNSFISLMEDFIDKLMNDKLLNGGWLIFVHDEFDQNLEEITRAVQAEKDFQLTKLRMRREDAASSSSSTTPSSSSSSSAALMASTMAASMGRGDRKNTKQVWNSFMDKVRRRGKIGYVCTTNVPFGVFQRVEKSLLDKHRVSRVFEHPNYENEWLVNEPEALSSSPNEDDEEEEEASTGFAAPAQSIRAFEDDFEDDFGDEVAESEVTTCANAKKDV